MPMVTCDVRAKGCAELPSENILPPAQPSASCWVIVLHPEARATRSKMGKRTRQVPTEQLGLAIALGTPQAASETTRLLASTTRLHEASRRVLGARSRLRRKRRPSKPTSVTGRSQKAGRYEKDGRLNASWHTPTRHQQAHFLNCERAVPRALLASKVPALLFEGLKKTCALDSRAVMS